MSCFTFQYNPLTCCYCLIWNVIQNPLQKHLYYQITFNYVNESYKARTVSLFRGTLAIGILLFLLYHVNNDWMPNCYPECPRGSPRLIKNCFPQRDISLVECCQWIFFFFLSFLPFLLLSFHAFCILVQIPRCFLNHNFTRNRVEHESGKWWFMGFVAHGPPDISQITMNVLFLFLHCPPPIFLHPQILPHPH